MCSNFQEELLQSYSDADLADHIQASPRLAPSSSIFLLSTNLLAKYYQPNLVEDTVRVVELARQLGVRVPDIKRVIELNGNAYCIMERIEGTTLEEAWAQLSWRTTIKLAMQLRRFVHLLRSVPSLTAGSVATGECRSFWLDDRYSLPARSSPEVITSFITFWVGFISIRQAMKAAAQGSLHPQGYIPPTAKTFVFTHHDLAPRNLLLDSSGQLWLLDWDYAGWYPSYFEYASMQNFFIPQGWDWLSRIRWYLFSWITVGRFEQEMRVLREIRAKFTRYRVGRRFEILKNGAPSRYPAS
jgi:serine/threonine protein kinase